MIRSPILCTILHRLVFALLRAFQNVSNLNMTERVEQGDSLIMYNSILYAVCISYKQIRPLMPYIIYKLSYKKALIKKYSC